MLPVVAFADEVQSCSKFAQLSAEVLLVHSKLLSFVDFSTVTGFSCFRMLALLQELLPQGQVWHLKQTYIFHGSSCESYDGG